MTIRELHRWMPGDPRYEAICIRCGEHVAEFNHPDNAREAIEAGGGALVKDAYLVTDCVAACAGCAEQCLCQVCDALLEDNLCPICSQEADDD